MTGFRKLISKKSEIIMRTGCLVSVFTYIRVIVILGAELKAMTEMLKGLVMIGKF